MEGLSKRGVSVKLWPSQNGNTSSMRAKMSQRASGRTNISEKEAEIIIDYFKMVHKKLGIILGSEIEGGENEH